MEGESFQQPQDPPLTFADLGIPIEQKTTITIIGTARTCSSLTRWEWAYLILSIVSLCAALGVTITTLARIETGTRDFTLGLVLLWTTSFCFYYVVHGVLKERPNELMVFVASIAVVAVYSIVNYIGSQTKLKEARLILVCVFGPVLIAAGIWLSREYHLSGNLIYRTVGANGNFQSMCRTMFLCSSLLKFDLQLQGSMLILVMENGTNMSDIEKILLAVGIVVTVIFISLGFLSMRLENKVFAIIFLAMSVSEPAYIIYKFYLAGAAKVEGVVHIVTYICGVFAFLVWLSVIICMWFVIKNFGKGLKEKVYHKPEKELLKNVGSYIKYNDDVDELPVTTTKRFYGDDPEQVPTSNVESTASVEKN